MQKSFQALKEPTNRKIIQLLHEDMTIDELSKQLNLSELEISQHISVLCEIGIVQEVKEGETAFYHLNTKALDEILVSKYYLQL